MSSSLQEAGSVGEKQTAAAAQRDLDSSRSSARGDLGQAHTPTWVSISLTVLGGMRGVALDDFPRSLQFWYSMTRDLLSASPEQGSHRGPGTCSRRLDPLGSVLEAPASLLGGLSHLRASVSTPVK